MSSDWLSRSTNQNFHPLPISYRSLARPISPYRRFLFFLFRRVFFVTSRRGHRRGIDSALFLEEQEEEEEQEERGRLGKRLTPTLGRGGRFRKTWGAKSTTPGGHAGGKGKSFESTGDTSDGDSVDLDGTTVNAWDSDESGFDSEEDYEEKDSGDASTAGNAGDGVVWELKSGEEAKLEGMNMRQTLKLQVGFAPSAKNCTVR